MKNKKNYIIIYIIGLRLSYNTHHMKNKKSYIIEKNIVFYSLSFILNIKFYKFQINKYLFK